MRRAGVLLLVALTLVASPAAADLLCRARSGRLFMRASCKKREVSLDLPKGPSGDPGPPAGVPLRVVDDAGLPVGAFAEAARGDDATGVAFDVGDRLVVFLVGAAGFNGGGSFLHLVADCADAPLLYGSPGQLISLGSVVGSTAYYPVDPIEPKSIVSAEFAPNGTCPAMSVALPNGNCCWNLSFAAVVGPAMKAFDLPSLGLTLPLHLEP